MKMWLQKEEWLPSLSSHTEVAGVMVSQTVVFHTKGLVSHTKVALCMTSRTTRMASATVEWLPTSGERLPTQEQLTPIKCESLSEGGSGFPHKKNGFCHSGVASHIWGKASYTGAINTHKA